MHVNFVCFNNPQCLIHKFTANNEMTEFLLKNSDAVAAVIIYQEKQSDSLENALIRVSNVLNIRYNRPSFDYLKHCLKM